MTVAMLQRVLGAVFDAYLLVFVTAMICTGLELAFPRGATTLSQRLLAAKFWVVNAAVVALFTLVVSHLLAHDGVGPIWTLDLGPHAAFLRHLPSPAVLVLAPLVAAAIGDFFAYWVHRALHRVPFLWRIHRLHHAMTELNAWTNIAHFFEGSLQALVGGVALAWLVHPVVGIAFPFEMALLKLLGPFQHSATQVHFGPLRRIFADNRYHRIHHARDPAHYNRNFANFTTLWDQLFGTAYFPQRHEWPQTGLADVAPPATLKDYVLFPFLPAKPLREEIAGPKLTNPAA